MKTNNFKIKIDDFLFFIKENKKDISILTIKILIIFLGFLSTVILCFAFVFAIDIMILYLKLRAIEYLGALL